MGCRCVGNSLHLKAKYGHGYRIILVTDPEKAEAVAGMVQTLAPCTFSWSGLLVTTTRGRWIHGLTSSGGELRVAATCDSNTAGSLAFSVPLSKIDEIPNIFTSIEQGQLPGVRDWGLSHTSTSHRVSAPPLMFDIFIFSSRIDRFPVLRSDRVRDVADVVTYRWCVA